MLAAYSLRKHLQYDVPLAVSFGNVSQSVQWLLWTGYLHWALLSQEGSESVPSLHEVMSAHLESLSQSYYLDASGQTPDLSSFETLYTYLHAWQMLLIGGGKSESTWGEEKFDMASQF